MSNQSVFKSRIKKIFGLIIIAALFLCLCLFLVPKKEAVSFSDNQTLFMPTYYTSQPNSIELGINASENDKVCYFYVLDGSDADSNNGTNSNNTTDLTESSDADKSHKSLIKIGSQQIAKNAETLKFNINTSWKEGIQYEYYYAVAEPGIQLPDKIDYNNEKGTYDVIQNDGKACIDVNMFSIYFYTEAPMITVNECSCGWSKDNFTFEFTVDGNCPVNKNSVEVNANGSALSSTVRQISSTDTYEATITGEQEYQGPVTVMAANMAGVYSQAYCQVKFDNSAPDCNAFRIENIEPTQHPVKNGDKVKAVFSLIDQGSGVNPDSVKVYYGTGDEEYVKAIKFNNNEYSCELVVGAQIKNDYKKELGISKIVCSDYVGNEANINPVVNSSVLYYDNIEITKLGLTTDNESGNCVKNSNTIYISFSSNHKIIPTVSEFFGDTGNNPPHIAWDVKDNGQGGYFYQGSYVVNSQGDKQKNLTFNLCMIDEAGNKTDVYNEKDFNNAITYYPPIEDCIQNVSLKLDTIREQKQYAVNNDKVNVVIDKEDFVEVKSVLIAGKELSKDESNNYVYQIENGTLDDNSEIKADIVLTNSAGETYTVKDEEINGNIKYFAPIKTSAVSLNTSNEVKNVVKDNDVLTVSFSTQHAVSQPVGKIAGVNASFSSTNNIDWKGKITVPKDKLQDNQVVDFDVNLSDIAGQSSKLISGSFVTQINYIAPIKVTDIVFKSTNQNDSSKYVKTGDKVVYSFVTNHDVIVSKAMIDKYKGNVSKENLTNGAKKIIVSYDVKYNDFKDLQNIGFEASMTDTAGNDIVNISSGQTGSNIKYYAPLTCNTSIMSDDEKSQFVKNSSNVVIICEPNHDAHITSAIVLGKSAIFNSSQSSKLKIEYLIPVNARNIPDGNISFNYSLADVAGNTLDVNNVSDGSRLIYDNTSPVISLIPEFSANADDGIKFLFTFTDKNIDPKNINIFINNKLVNMSGAEIDSTKGIIRKLLTFDKEGTYAVTANVKDKAGNSNLSDLSCRFTIDMSNPEIITLKMSYDKLKCYSRNMMISDILNISDIDLKNVICTVTDDSGTYDWDLSKSFATDGKKTLNLLIKGADNGKAQKFVYEFYIDGTAPNIITTNDDKGLNTNQDNVFVKIPTSVQISLNQKNIDNFEDKDKFVKLCVLNDKKEVICDLLDNDEELKDRYSYSFINYGQYYIEVQATDSVGNLTTLNYKIVIDKPVNYKLIIGAIITAIIIAGTTVLLFVKKKRKPHIIIF